MRSQTQDSPPARVVLSTLSYVQEEMFFAKLLLRGEPQRPAIIIES